MASYDSTSHVSSKYGTISNTNKDLVRTRDGGDCWACGFHSDDVLNYYHVIPRSQSLQFVCYQDYGYLPPGINVAHPDNFIVLCANCHGGFDSPLPGLVILPTNIKFFIEYEKRDYESRKGKPGPRSVPTAKEYKDAGGMYKAYPLKSCYRPSTEKTWGGSPEAMIIKGSLGVNLPPPLTADPLPPGTRAQVAELMDLWARPPPTTARNEGDEKTQKTKHRSSDSSDSEPLLDNHLKRKRHATESVMGTNRKPATDKGGNPAEVEKPAKMFPNLDGACDDKYYCLGPNMSANDVIMKYVGYRNYEF